MPVIFSRGHATLHLAESVGRSVGLSATFLNSERFSHCRSCPTVCDWIAVYPALFELLTDPEQCPTTHVAVAVYPVLFLLGFLFLNEVH